MCVEEIIRRFVFIFGVLVGPLQAQGQADEPPYVSLVPKFTFGTTLQEQEDQLKNNPLVLRFAESRRGFAKTPQGRNRPIYHMSSPEGRLGDPNGLCFWNGNWHLFYQAYPPDDRRQHWGHTVSRDLVHWKDLPYALYPGPEQAVYSGSTYVEDDRVIAMYHGTLVGNMVALADDPLLLNWSKILKDGSAVIPMLSPAGVPLPYSVFDPAIWKKDGIYYSLSAGKAPNGPGGKEVATGYLFKSRDLANWEYQHEFVQGDRFTLIGDDYACPYFWPIGDRYIMNFFSHMSGGQFLLGDYDKVNDKFLVTSGSGSSGVGPPSSTPDGKGGVIVVYNVGGVMSIPRRLTLVGTDAVGQEPAGDLASLRYNEKAIGAMKLPANKELVLDGISGNTMEINLEIDMKNAQMIELDVLRSPDKEEYTRIVFYRGGGFGSGRAYGLGLLPVAKGDPVPAEYYTTFNGSMLRFLLNGAPIPAPAEGGRTNTRASIITIETSYSSLGRSSRPPLSAPVSLGKDETLKLRVFLDKTVVEVFVNGKQALAANVNPLRENSVGVSLRSQGEDSELRFLEAWQMKGIY